MRKKRVLVTGASGFIGQPLVRALVRAGYTVRAAMRRPVPLPQSVEVVIVPDFNNSIDWYPFLQGVDIVIHLAGLTHADSRDIAFGAYDQVNWITTLELARVAKDVGVDHFVYISSVRAQTGPSTKRIVDEEDEPRPTDHYGRSKLAAELAIRSVGLPFTILRPVAIFGPHSKGNIKRLFQLAASLVPLPFKGFNNQRSLLGIDNFINAILFVLNNKTTIGEKFLIADATPLKLPELIAMLRKAQGRKSGLVYVPPFFIRLALLLSGQRRLWERVSEDLIVDTSKLQSLGWHPTVETYEGLRSALAAENGEGL
ncbi:MAG TPA: NAD-dependent epimerase/dehydratase family protein [Thermoguttaceae bacterium]